jgi:hypothetical protein
MPCDTLGHLELQLTLAVHPDLRYVSDLFEGEPYSPNHCL